MVTKNMKLIGPAEAAVPINVSLLDLCMEQQNGVQIRVQVEKEEEIKGRFLPRKWIDNRGLNSLGYIGAFIDEAKEVTENVVLLYTPSKTEYWELYFPN